VWDRINTITVTLRYRQHQLESLPEYDVLCGKNSAWLGAADGSHGEIIQFATATLVTANPRVYTLSNLLRGRRATEHEMALHNDGDLFVALESNYMRELDYGIGDWDRSRIYKGVSVYQDPNAVFDWTTFTNVGERAMCRSPINAVGVRDGTNNLTITWTPRTRGFVPGIGYGPVPVGEAVEAYELDIVVGIAVVRTISASLATSNYSSAQQIADGITPGDPVSLLIYQLSATRGRGHPGAFLL
jgi:hypothetical protein